MLNFVLRNATQTLQKIFKQRYRAAKGRDWNSDSVKDFIDNEGHEIFKSFNKDQRQVMQETSVEDWDISLLSLLLLKTPLLRGNQFKSDKQQIKSLKEIRNQIMHNASMKITDAEFEKYCKDIEDILVYFGENRSTISSLKTIKISELEETPANSNQTSEMNKLKQRANDSFSAKRYEDAIHLYSQCLNLPNLSDKDRSILYSNRSVSYLKLNNLRNAYIDAKICIRYRPTWPKAYYRKGRVLHEMKNFEKAIKVYNAGLLIDPNNKELIEALQETNIDNEKIKRHEHLDSSFQTSSLEEICQNMSKTQHVSMTPEKLKILAKDSPLWSGIIALHEGKPEEAVKLFTKGAEEGDPEAMYNLSVQLMSGNGTVRNLQQARIWLEKAITKPERTRGVSDAYRALGNIYSEGNGVEIDMYKALFFYQKSAELGDSGAQNNLGVFYLEGREPFVTKNINKAFDYFHSAATKGLSRAMLNLARIYCSDKNLQDGEKAKLWFERASEAGFKLADMEMSYALQLIEHEKEEMVKLDVFGWERDLNLDIANMTLAERIDRKVKGNAPPKKPLKTLFEDRYPLEQLVEYSGHSKVAKRLLQAKTLFLDAVTLIRNNAQQKNDDVILEKLYNSLCLYSSISNFDQETLKKTVKIILSKLQKNPRDKHAMLCSLYYARREDAQYTSSFIKDCIKTHPQERIFYKTASMAYAMMSKFSEALSITNDAIKMFPDDIQFYYLRANAQRLNSVADMSGAIKDLHYYLANADKQEEEVVHCYYLLSFLYLQEKEMENAEKYFKLGQEFESKLLPFYKPYSFPPKSAVEAALSKPKVDRSRKLENPLRIELRNRHRQVFANNIAMHQNNKYSVCLNIEGKHSTQESVKSLIGLKQIFLEEMDYNADKVYKGYVISGVLIELPIPMSAKHSLIEDERGQIITISFYGSDKIDPSMFRVGQKVLIVNPYMRQSMDGTRTIRVDDPKTVVWGDFMPICWCCSKSEEEVPKLSLCSGCKKALYCSKGCQEIDWKVYSHKTICSIIK